MDSADPGQPRKRKRAEAAGPQPAADDLANIQALYDRGRAYDAYRATLHFAPMRDWHDPEARVLAGRLAHHLGAPQMADSLMLLAWRRSPDNLHARYFGIRALLSRRGPLEALGAIERYPVPVDDPILHAEWLALKGHILGSFRDFARAEALLAEARRIAPDHHWIALEAASLLGMQDRVDEALAEARRGFELQPLHPGATLAQAQILLLLARDDEAIGALDAAMENVQSSSIAAFLASLLTERERYTEALQAWEFCQVLMPMIEKPTRAWLFGHLSHMQYLLGNIEESKRLAKTSGDSVLEHLASRLEDGPTVGHRRLKIDVPFIKQHHVTCVPTTMAMLGRFWGQDLEHLAIADQITYGGTATHRERQWAESHNWIVREFTVTWDAAVALLDRRVPFTLTTAGGDVGHEQAIAGYDTHRRTLLIRDPSTPGMREIDFDSLLKSEQSSGPRAMIMLPQSEGHRLDDIDLPEAAERDVLHRIMLALDKHDRGEAERVAQTLMPAPAQTGVSVPHRIAHLARQTLAMYDQDVVALLRSVDEELTAFPNDTQLLMQKQRCLAELSRSAERTALLRELANGTDGHPIFIRIYAEALSDSAAEHEAALVYLRRYLRNVALDPEGLRVMANVTWAAQRFEEATALYRLAASLGETNESMATSYFIAAALTGKQEEALEFLGDRAWRASARASLPARTLFWALEQLFRIDEAFEGLQKAMSLRPDDGELVLFAADWYARFSRPGVDDLLRKAEPITRKADFLATRASIHGYRGELQKSLADWMQVFEMQPLSTEAHQAICQTLEQVEGKPAVIRFLEQLIERFPGYRPAHALLAGATRDSDPARHERAVRRLLEIAPNDAWAHRELAIHLANNGRFDEGLSEAARAEEIAPAEAAGPTVRGRVLMLAGRNAEAREAFLEALDLLADEPYAIAFIGATATDGKEREKLHENLFDKIIAKTAYGEGLLGWFDVARANIAAPRMLELVTAAVTRRPDLWQAHSIAIQQLITMRQTTDAVARAEQATSRFPLQPALWMNAAAAYRAAGDQDKEAAALETSLRLTATNSEAAAELAMLLQRRNEHDRAIAVLSSAAAAAPLDPIVQWMLGGALWTRGEKDDALKRVARAAKLAPDHGGIWDDLREYSMEAQQPDLPHRTAEELVEEKPGNALAWLALAATEKDLDARLTAIERAIAVDPSSESAYDRKAVVLTEAGRFIEALDACAGPNANRRPSLALRGRESWVRYRQGDVKTAIEKMSAILSDEPNYGWGWYQLCQWYSAANDKEKYRTAAKELARISPDAVLSWNHLGEAELLNNNVQGAEECFARALDLDPANVFASLSMIDIHLDGKRIARASELLEQSEVRTHHPAFKLKRLEIALRRKKRDEVTAAMTAMAADPSLDFDMVQQAIARMRQTGYEDDLRQILQSASRGPKMNPAAAAEQVRVMLEKNRTKEALDWIDSMRAGQEETAHAAAISFLDSTANRRESKWLDAFGNRFPRWAMDDTEIWGMCGYVRVVLRQYHSCVSSMSDWANRKETRPAMLLNLALAYRNIDDEASGAKVNEFALQLPEDQTTDEHRVWVALDAALDGRYENADKRISAIPMDRLNSVHQLIARLVWALVVAARERKKGGKWRPAASEQLHLVISARRTGQVVPIVAKYYRKAIARLRADFVKGLFDSLWAFQMRSQI
ncbi:MAG TPA: tetratricopeptide repeat protein [Thermoanaerobaculia bacterium]|nr:tetratricopeptide repeat protein [Thermoanaerobaculia bacterium]